MPDLDDDSSLVSGTRVLAIVSEPPEAGEGDSVKLTALSRLGPRRPSAEPGQPAGRAADPDSTGGFYQPVTAELPGQLAVLGGVRLDCGLASAERTQVIEYNQRHRINVNPRVDRLESEEAGVRTEIGAGAAHRVSPGRSLVLRASWAECASESPCTGAEPFVMFDSEAQAVVDRTETVIASWYATAGDFDEHRTTASLAVPAQAKNTWRAPPGPADVGLWVVLRDGRGGVGYAAYRFQVQ